MSDLLRDPLPEAQIMRRWRPEKGRLVSVCMLTYNHGPYLKNAFNSILNQKTDFGFEILVHDDASQDDTQAIIHDYASRYPEIIKPICQEINQYSQGINPSVRYNYPRAQLPFVAMCEGDDHWTADDKLQVQINGLLAHPHINLSFHPAVRVDFDKPDRPSSVLGDYALDDAVIPFSDMLHRIRGWIPTAGCVIRQSAKQRLHAFMSERSYLSVGDIYFQFFGAEPAGALYFARPMSLYRYGTEHSWTRKVLSDALSLAKASHEKAMLYSYVELDALTRGAYHDDFVALTLQRLFWLFNTSPAVKTIAALGLEAVHALDADCQATLSQTLARLERIPTRYLVFGCGSGCHLALRNLSSDKVLAVVDRDNRRIGETLLGKPVIGTDALGRYPGADLLISTLPANRSMIAQLADAAGIADDRIHYLYDDALHLVAHRYTVLHELRF